MRPEIESQTLSYATPEDPVRADDHYYLRVLAYCHWALGAMIAFGGVMAYLAVAHRDARTWCAAMIVLGILSAAVGVFLLSRRYLWFILCVSAFTLLIFPLGTILGISTIGVLRRRGVTALFNARGRQPGAAASPSAKVRHDSHLSV